MRVPHTPDQALKWVFIAAVLASIWIGASQNLGAGDPVNPRYDLAGAFR